LVLTSLTDEKSTEDKHDSKGNNEQEPPKDNENKDKDQKDKDKEKEKEKEKDKDKKDEEDKGSKSQLPLGFNFGDQGFSTRIMGLASVAITFYFLYLFFNPPGNEQQLSWQEFTTKYLSQRKVTTHTYLYIREHACMHTSAHSVFDLIDLNTYTTRLVRVAHVATCCAGCTLGGDKDKEYWTNQSSCALEARSRAGVQHTFNAFLHCMKTSLHQLQRNILLNVVLFVVCVHVCVFL
jgi:hypothetical protein